MSSIGHLILCLRLTTLIGQNEPTLDLQSNVLSRGINLTLVKQRLNLRPLAEVTRI